MVPRLFLTLAQELAQADDPAACRTAISRSYYAVFHTAERFLKRMGFHRPKKDHHTALQRRLQNSGDAEISSVGIQLGQLHHERVQADYYLDNHWSEQKDTAITVAKKSAALIDILEACPIHGDRWKNIRAAIAKANITGVDNLVDTSDNP
ncbi:MAG: hypothetical protein L0Y71_03680 [Gemmataceae bacterium]|nr:hypothetical protein [Gemmataceae bacterium]